MTVILLSIYVCSREQEKGIGAHATAKGHEMSQFHVDMVHYRQVYLFLFLMEIFNGKLCARGLESNLCLGKLVAELSDTD